MFGPVLGAGVLLVILSGCASAPIDGPSYYLLDAQAERANAIELTQFKVGLGPVELPTYLERDGILTFSNNNQLNYSENHRWAEPLQESVLEVLRENFTRLLPKQQFILFPWRQLDKPRYQVEINITQFALQADDAVVLAAVWMLHNDDGEQIVVENSQLSLPVASLDYADVVNAQSHLLSKLSVQIARALADISAG